MEWHLLAEDAATGHELGTGEHTHTHTVSEQINRAFVRWVTPLSMQLFVSMMDCEVEYYPSLTDSCGSIFIYFPSHSIILSGPLLIDCSHKKWDLSRLVEQEMDIQQRRNVFIYPERSHSDQSNNPNNHVWAPQSLSIDLTTRTKGVSTNTHLCFSLKSQRGHTQ